MAETAWKCLLFSISMEDLQSGGDIVPTDSKQIFVTPAVRLNLFPGTRVFTLGELPLTSFFSSRAAAEAARIDTPIIGTASVACFPDIPLPEGGIAASIRQRLA
jgi:hypothetical protein